MGTYPSFLVHLLVSAALYFMALYGVRFVLRRWKGVAEHWIRLSIPALPVLLIAFFREAFDGGGAKAFFDNLSWLLGCAASVYLAHRLLKDKPFESIS